MNWIMHLHLLLAKYRGKPKLKFTWNSVSSSTYLPVYLPTELVREGNPPNTNRHTQQWTQTGTDNVYLIIFAGCHPYGWTQNAMMNGLEQPLSTDFLRLTSLNRTRLISQNNNLIFRFEESEKIILYKTSKTFTESNVKCIDVLKYYCKSKLKSKTQLIAKLRKDLKAASCEYFTRTTITRIEV